MNIDIAGLAHGAASVGYPLLFALVLAASAGAPLPIGVLLAGLGAASVYEGGPNFVLLAAGGLAASVAGDGIDFGIGRLGGRRALGWAGARLRRNRLLAALPLIRLGPPPKQELLLFLSRFALTPIATPVSLLAGATGLSLVAFLLWDAAGEGLFVVGNLAVGRVLSADGLSDDGLLIALGVLAELSYAGIWAATQYITRHQRAMLQSAAADATVGTTDDATSPSGVWGVEQSRRGERITLVEQTVSPHTSAATSPHTSAATSPHTRRAPHRIVWGRHTVAWETVLLRRTQRAGYTKAAKRHDITI